MIAKGIPHRHGARLANYLITAKSGEHAELCELRGFAALDIVEAFRSVHVVAAATKCEEAFFHVTVRNAEGEHLRRSQWRYTADRIERMLGLVDQPRAIAFHMDKKTGHEHMHLAWSRIDDERLTAKPLPFYKLRLKRVCRDLETHFGFAQVRDRRESSIQYAPKRVEEEQARRLGLDIHDVRETIRQCFDRSDCGRSFEAALAKQGLILVRGERRDFVVLDGAGGLHALGKRTLGISAAQIRARLSDLSAQRLPSAEQGRALIRRRKGKSEDSEDPTSIIAHLIPQLGTAGGSENTAVETQRNADAQAARMVMCPSHRGQELRTPQPGSEAKPDSVQGNVSVAPSEALPLDAQTQKRQSFAQSLKQQFRSAMQGVTRVVPKSNPKESRKGSGGAIGIFRRVAKIICCRSAGMRRISEVSGFTYDTFAWLHAWIWNELRDGDQIEASPHDSEQDHPSPHP